MILQYGSQRPAECATLEEAGMTIRKHNPSNCSDAQMALLKELDKSPMIKRVSDGRALKINLESAGEFDIQVMMPKTGAVIALVRISQKGFVTIFERANGNMSVEDKASMVASHIAWAFDNPPKPAAKA